LNPALAEFFVNFNLSQNGKKGVQTVRFEWAEHIGFSNMWATCDKKFQQILLYVP
jgi:hypothetical protein